MGNELSSLEQRNKDWIAIVNNRDAEAYAKLLTEDVVWFPPDGDPIVGREAFKRWLAPFFSRFKYDFNISDKQIKIAGVKAVEKASFTSEMTPEEGGKKIRHSGTFITLWHRDVEGTWRIERYIDDTNV